MHYDKIKKMGIFEIQKGRRNLNMKIYHAQVNHLENPVGFRMERTVFSWKIKEAKGKQQSYARIRVSSGAGAWRLYDREFSGGRGNGGTWTA